MEGVKIYKMPRLNNPYFIVAWPGMGEVAFKAVSYLVSKLEAVEFAEIAAEGIFYLTTSVVQEGVLSLPSLPFSKFYYVKDRSGKRDLILFVSNAQPDLAKAEGYCEKIISIVRGFKVKMVVSFAAMPQAIDHMHSPNVWFVSTSKELNNNLKRLSLNLLSEGQISGMNGLFLGIAKRAGFEGICLLGEVPLYTIQIENPRASCAVLEALSRILNIKIELAGLMEDVQIMENQINKLLEHLNVIPTVGPIDEDDIEKIKKSLTQLTKLPISVKEKIEQLFIQAEADIARANELKAELDKWNVYREYEDRFFDLFKKR